MKNIKQTKMGALYLDGAAQVNPAYLEAGTIPQYQSGAKIMIGEIPADHSECTITWNEVRLPNGQTLLIADRVLLTDVSYDDLEVAGFVEGKKVTLDGKDYLCRLLHCNEGDRENDEWDQALDAAGEDDTLWHWQNTLSWAIAPTDALSLVWLRAFRGYASARYFFWVSPGTRDASLGFRPVLVPLSSDKSKGESHTKRSKRTAEIRVDTPKGVIVVKVNDPSFPGVSVDLERDGDRIGIATIESDTDNDGAITAWVYADATSGDYTHRLVVKGIDS